MNNKGFSLIELLGALTVLGLILCVGLYSAKGTLATALSTMTDVSENEIYDAASVYVLEKPNNWINEVDEYTCLTVDDLVDAGYFDEDEVISYKNDKIKVVRDEHTKVISSIELVDVCE